MTRNMARMHLSCASCKHWASSGKTEWGTNQPLGVCSGKAAEFANATADDDTNLSTTFEPPATFGCQGWAAKDRA